MKTFLKIAAATSLTLAGFGVAQADDDIVVSRSASTEALAREMSQGLSDEFARLHWRELPQNGQGIAKVRFQIGSQGQPENVTLYSPSGDRKIDNAAQKVVSRLYTNGDRQAVISRDQTFQANIIYAQSENDMRRLSRQLAKEERVRMASAPKENAVLALNLVSSPRS